MAAVALLLPASLAAVGLATRFRSRAELREAGGKVREEAATLSADARKNATLAANQRDAAFSAFDQPGFESQDKGEKAWSAVLTLESKADEWLKILDHALQTSAQGV